MRYPWEEAKLPKLPSWEGGALPGSRVPAVRLLSGGACAATVRSPRQLTRREGRAGRIGAAGPWPGSAAQKTAAAAGVVADGSAAAGSRDRSGLARRAGGRGAVPTGGGGGGGCGAGWACRARPTHGGGSGRKQSAVGGRSSTDRDRLPVSKTVDISPARGQSRYETVRLPRWMTV